MIDTCVKVENLSKRFLIFKRKETLLRVLKSLVSRDSLKEILWALRDISFEVKKGDKLALIGKNGSGKTTLLRILAGIYDKTSGCIRAECAPAALFKSWIGLNGILPVIDNIYLYGAMHGMSRDFLKDKVSAILELAELSHLQFSPLRQLSTGQMQRLTLSVFFQNTSDFLIFDESLAFVDQAFTQKCETYFQNLYSSDKTVIMASHDLSFLRKYCKTAIWLADGRVQMLGEAKKVTSEYENASRLKD